MAGHEPLTLTDFCFPYTLGMKWYETEGQYERVKRRGFNILQRIQKYDIFTRVF